MDIKYFFSLSFSTNFGKSSFPVFDFLRLISYMKEGEFKHEVRQFEKSYDNQQAEQISLMV